MRATRILLLGLVCSLTLMTAHELYGQRLFKWMPSHSGLGCRRAIIGRHACPCSSCQSVVPDAAVQPYLDPNQFLTPDPSTDPGVSPDAGSVDPTQADSFAMTSQFGGGTEGLGARDITIGDFFSDGGRILGGTWGAAGITTPIAGGDRRYKVSDHFSPLPVNRLFFSYHGFGDAAVDVNANQLDVQRYTFGLERTFWGNMASFEIRLPFAHGVDNTQFQTTFGGATNSGTEFGNLVVATKFLLIQRCNYSISGGLAATLPTADDGEMFERGANIPTVAIENRAAELIPFMALYVKPSPCSWVTLSSQLDFNIRGNRVTSFPGTGLASTGIYNDQNLMSFDISAGRWFRYNPDSCRLVSGIAGILEMHYTTTLNDADIVDAGDPFFGDVMTNPFNRIDVLNITAGTRVLIRDRTFVTLAGVLPLRGQDDRPFDAEFNLNISRLY